MCVRISRKRMEYKCCCVCYVRILAIYNIILVKGVFASDLWYIQHTSRARARRRHTVRMRRNAAKKLPFGGEDDLFASAMHNPEITC